MSLFELLSAIGVLLGGAWALLQYHLSVSKDLEKEKESRHSDLLISLREFTKSLSDKLKEIEAKLDSTTDLLREEINELKVTLSSFGFEVKQNKDDILRTHSTFMDLLEKVRSYQVRHIGEDAYKIEAKKAKE